MKISIILLTLFISISKANADWIFVQSSDDKSTDLYIDGESIQIINKDIRRYWSKSNLQESELTKYGNYQSLRAFNEIDCKNKKFRGLSISFYEKNNLLGKVIHSQEDENSKWSFIPPNSLGSISSDIVCSIKK
jgi:hypothetical protein